MVLVNIGCGASFHPAWLNFDIEPATREVRPLDTRLGIPLPDASADACYCSHVIEHLTVVETRKVLSDIHRVLKPGGIVRIVVPDLEGIVRAYLRELEGAVRGDVESAGRYEWLTIELLDQMIRRRCGGEMAVFLRGCPDEIKPFIVSRIGREAEAFWTDSSDTALPPRRLGGKSISWFIDKVRYPVLIMLATLVGGSRGRQVVQEGWFLSRGEVHRWMYDRYSLGHELERAGFAAVTICQPNESKIPNFNDYELDISAGQVRKPDSLFAEAVKI